MKTSPKKSPTKLVPGSNASSNVSISNALVSITEASEPKLPHERDQSVSKTKVKPGESMKQAHRDVSRGLQDTDRGPEADRTYKKLKR